MVMLADKDVGNEANYKTAKEWWYKYCNVKTPGYEYFSRDGVRYKRLHALLKNKKFGRDRVQRRVLSYI
jgi:hypothetical protein